MTVVESPLDEEETASGLIVPRSATAGESDDPLARRGIVQARDIAIHEGSYAWSAAAERLEPGTVVYFVSPTRIQGDILVVAFSDILAYEES